MSGVSLPARPRRSGARPLVPHRLLGDDRLAALAAAGDRRAFAAIYERYHQALYRYCRSMLRVDEDARDAVQNTMAASLRALDGERRSIALKPWLYRIAHNESMTLLRRRRNEPPLDTAEEIADHRAADHATRERLRELVVDLRQLPEQQRGALVMRELSGLGYGEIGAALGISPAAATRAVYDARQGLHAFADGRAMGCDAVRELISASDRRALRARRVRGHLRACSSCAGFQAALEQRPRDLALLAPALPAASAAALLHGVLGGGSGGGGGAGAAAAGGAATKTASAWLAVKAVVVAGAVTAAGAGAAHVGAGVAGGGGSKPAPSAAAHATPTTARPPAVPARTATGRAGPAAGRSARHERRAAAGKPRRHKAHRGGPGLRHRPARAQHAHAHAHGRGSTAHPTLHVHQAPRAAPVPHPAAPPSAPAVAPPSREPAAATPHPAAPAPAAPAAPGGAGQPAAGGGAQRGGPPGAP